jgi:hypothetical protein
MDRAVVKQLLDYAVANGYVAVLITLDQNTQGNRWCVGRNRKRSFPACFHLKLHWQMIVLPRQAWDIGKTQKRTSPF